MLGLSLPVWRWNKVGPARQEAQASLASAEAEREQTRNDVRAMVRDAWTMMTTSRTQVNLYRDSVIPQAEQSLASARTAYETNRAGFLDLLDAQRSLLESRLEYQTALVDYLKSRADLGLAVGDPRLLGVPHE
jgi:outer membrane protein TolC